MAPITAFQIADLPVAQAVAAIRRGLPPTAIADVARALSMSSTDLAAKLGLPARRGPSQRKKSPRLSREDTEKLVRAAHLQRQARKIFITDEAAAQWLASPAPALDGMAPLDLLDTGFGAREVEAVLSGIAHGNVL